MGSLRVGIIGAGLSGCVAAARLREVRPDATIQIFERDSRIGGRIRTIPFHGRAIEVGASFFHSSNRALLALVGALDLPLLERRRSDTLDAEPAAVWNGRVFVLNLPTRRVGSVLRLLARFGMSPIRIRQLARDMVTKWSAIYEAQEAGRSFRTPAKLVDALGLSTLVHQDTYRFLSNEGVSGDAVELLFNPASRAIYNQDASINAFAGMVALVGAGIAGGETMAVDGGNSRLCEGLVRMAAAELHLGTSIRKVECPRGKREILMTDDAGARIKVDAVIIAAPSSMTEIQLRFEGQRRLWAPAPKTQITHVTCVAGRLSPKYFRLRERRLLPQAVLTTNVDEIPFSIISRQGACSRGDSVYKIQSTSPIDESVASAMFDRLTDMHPTVWAAYPRLAPVRRLSPFVLARGVYYANAMEPVVSTLETETVASRNAVALLCEDFRSVTKS